MSSQPNDSPGSAENEGETTLCEHGWSPNTGLGPCVLCNPSLVPPPVLGSGPMWIDQRYRGYDGTDEARAAYEAKSGYREGDRMGSPSAAPVPAGEPERWEKCPTCKGEDEVVDPASGYHITTCTNPDCEFGLIRVSAGEGEAPATCPECHVRPLIFGAKSGWTCSHCGPVTPPDAGGRTELTESEEKALQAALALLPAEHAQAITLTLGVYETQLDAARRELEEVRDRERQAATAIAAACLSAGCPGESGGIVSAVEQLAAQLDAARRERDSWAENARDSLAETIAAEVKAERAESRLAEAERERDRLGKDLTAERAARAALREKVEGIAALQCDRTWPEEYERRVREACAAALAQEDDRRA